MRQLDRLTVYHQGQPRQIEIYHGDLTNVPPGEAFDVLIVSAFPNNYAPTPTSLIGALHRKGVEVGELAKHKAVDLRPTLACWLSEPIRKPPPGIGFERILCFEPLVKGRPPEAVGDIFQCLVSFAHGDPPITRVAMPLLSSGNMGVPLVDMLAPLVDAAKHWLELGLPIEQLKIVAFSELQAAELKGAFAVLKQQHTRAPKQQFEYDVFISYSHQNTEDVQYLVRELQRLRPGLRIFLDRMALNPGAAWQQEIFEALDSCSKVIAVFSPPYLESKVCKEEYNIALFRHRDCPDGVLIPIRLYSTSLPTYMKLVQYIDCVEGDRSKLQVACQQIAANL